MASLTVSPPNLMPACNMLVNGHLVVPIYDRSPLTKTLEILFGGFDNFIGFMLDSFWANILEFSTSCNIFQCAKW
jgi:hypothetical protein